MKQKLMKVVQLLREIDDELENDLCLKTSVLDDEYDIELTFWGVADIIEAYTREKK